MAHNHRIHMPTRAGGFTLIELMIVIAIVGILATVAVPQYTNYSKRARFSEVVLATTNFKSTAEVAVQTGRALTADALDAGTLGIPPTVTEGRAIGQYVSTVDMSDGVISAKGTDAVDNALYVLQATIPAGMQGIRWSEVTTDPKACQNLGIC